MMPVVPLDAASRCRRGRRTRPATRPVRRTSPTQPSPISNVGQGARDLVRQAGPGGDDQAVLREEADGHVVDAQGARRLVDDRPEELVAIVRRGQPFGDAQHRIETLRELGLEADRGAVRQLVAGAGQEASEERWPGRVDLWTGSRPGRGVAGFEARAHATASSHSGPPLPPRHPYRTGGYRSTRSRTARRPHGTVRGRRRDLRCWVAPDQRTPRKQRIERRSADPSYP